MKVFLVTIGTVIIIPLFLCVLVTLFTLLSGVGAWMVGLIWGDLILGFLSNWGIHGYTMFQLGICLGFFGSFFKAYTYVNKS